MSENRQLVTNYEQKELTTMAKNYIHSTASQDMNYPIFAGGTDRPQKIKDIIIKGRANVVDPRTLVTPTGAVTEISDADLELLKKSAAFQRHVARGFMRVMQESELNTADMQKKDNSAQLQDSEYSQGTDPRVPNSGNCQATCGERDCIVGKRGASFRPESD